MANNRPTRVHRSTQKPDYTYSHPETTRKARQKQRKEVHAQLRTNPESLHFDLRYNSPQAGNGQITDVLFWTDHINLWRDVCQDHYSGDGHTYTWKQIQHGMQLAVSGRTRITINFYDNGTVMVQGPHKKSWADTHFQLLKDCVTANRVPEKTQDNNSSSNEDDTSMSTPATSFMSVLSPVAEAVSTFLGSLTGSQPSHRSAQHSTSASPTGRNIRSSPSVISVAPRRLSLDFESTCSPEKANELQALSEDSLYGSDSEAGETDEADETESVSQQQTMTAIQETQPDTHTIPSSNSDCEQDDSTAAVPDSQQEQVSALVDRIHHLENKLADLQGVNKQLLSDLDVTRGQRDTLQCKLISLQDWVDSKQCVCSSKSAVKCNNKAVQTPSAVHSTAEQSTPEPTSNVQPEPSPSSKETSTPVVNNVSRKPKVTVLASSMGRYLATELNHRGNYSCYGSVNPSATAENLSAKVPQVSKVQKADYMVLMGGTNNVANGDRPRDVISAVEQLATSCKQNNPDATVVVSSLLHRTDKPHLNTSIDKINRVLRKKANSTGYVFMNSASQIKASHLKKDGLHLNASGVSKMARIVEGTIRQASRGSTYPGDHCPPFHQGHQKIQRPKQIPVLTSVRTCEPLPLNPWL